MTTCFTIFIYYSLLYSLLFIHFVKSVLLSCLVGEAAARLSLTCVRLLVIHHVLFNNAKITIVLHGL